MMLARLQLAVGQAAAILGEIEPDGPRRRFLARRPTDPPDQPASRLLILHPAPPDGPPSGALLDRMASIRAIGHAVLAAPLATGAFEGHAWAVEPLPTGSTIADRLAAGERFAVPDVVRVLRDVARGLAGLHRHNLAHGAVGPDAVTLNGEVVTLGRLASRHSGTPADDLAALGRLGWAMLAGPETTPAVDTLRGLRPTVPEELEAVLMALLHPVPDAGPPSAAAILESLDVLPVSGPSLLGALMDTAGRGSRVPGRRRAALMLAGIGLLAAMIWLLTRG